MELAHKLWGNHSQSIPERKILFLHGMSGVGSIWRPIAAHLESDYQILAPDQRGHGLSQINDEAQYGPLDFGQDIVDTCEALNFFPTWVVGHSMGVRTACAFAKLKPDWVKGLVLIDLGLSNFTGGGLGDQLTEFLIRTPVQFTSRAEARDYLKTNAPDPAIAAYLLAVSTEDSKGNFCFPFDRNALIQTMEAAKGNSVLPWLEAYAQTGKPVLALRGETSSVWKASDYQKEKEALASFQNVQFEVFRDTGHGLPFEKRDQFLKRLKSLISL